MPDLRSMNRPSYNPDLVVKDEPHETAQETLQRSDYDKIANLSPDELNALETALNAQIAQLQDQLRIVYYVRRADPYNPHRIAGRGAGENRGNVLD